MNEPTNSHERISNYTRWKSWDPGQFGHDSPGMNFFFARLRRKYFLPLGAACEIGFGSGQLLRILASQYDSTVGIEKLDELVAAANAKLKVKAFCGDCWSSGYASNSFDLIIGLSVLEHLDWYELQLLFGWLSESLKPGGMALFQFPEGSSPLGLGNAHGDFTHKTLLTRWKITFLSMGTELDIVAYDTEPVYSNRLSQSISGRILLRLLDRFRSAYSKLLRILVWPIAQNVLFRENSILVLRKRTPN